QDGPSCLVGKRILEVHAPRCSRASRRPGLHIRPENPFCPAMKPKILLVFLMRFEEASRILQGIVQHERSHRQWSTFLDDEARTGRDPEVLRGEKWHGVISRHTTPALVKNCAQLGIPLVDLNDTPSFPGVPKIRPNNTAIGHLGAEHFLERGFRHFAYCG